MEHDQRHEEYCAAVHQYEAAVAGKAAALLAADQGTYHDGRCFGEIQRGVCGAVNNGMREVIGYEYEWKVGTQLSIQDDDIDAALAAVKKCGRNDFYRSQS